MGQQLSIENAEYTSFITTRTAGSRLWFINNPALEKQILGCLARYQDIYGVVIYAFILMGNHYHLIAKFPNMNRAKFMRDFNSSVARIVGRTVQVHGRRSVWARRYAHQVLPRAYDVENWFYYAALNPVSSGITETMSDYCSYNSFFDSAHGIVRTYQYVEWSKYQNKRRHNPNTKIEEFTKEYELKYSRLPGCENVTAEEYVGRLKKELLSRQIKIADDRRQKGKGFLGIAGVNKTKIGAAPKSTKTSDRNSKRPVVLTLCDETREVELERYFTVRKEFKKASFDYRSGKHSVVFPVGTYPPGRGLVQLIAPLALSSNIQICSENLA